MILTFIMFYIAWKRQRTKTFGDNPRYQTWDAAMRDFRLFQKAIEKEKEGMSWPSGTSAAWSDDLCYLYDFYKDHLRAIEEMDEWHNKGGRSCLFCPGWENFWENKQHKH